MVGRDLEEEFPARSHAVGDEVLSVSHLSAPPRFSDASFTVRAGEVVALAGLIGAGRSSVGLAIAGALRSTGEVRVAGRAVRFRSPVDALAGGLAYVTEDRKAFGLFPWMDVRENITLSSLRVFARAGLLSAARERAAAIDAISSFDVRARGTAQRAGTLSGGNQQKVLVARFLIEPRRVVVLDEPTRGVDVGARAEIYSLMNRFAERGLGVLIISSDLPEVLCMADRIEVIREGRTVGELDRTSASAERVMALATGAR
jgi:ABC-type sugar transport system ATPase subunit